jgi:hypothetical protein
MEQIDRAELIERLKKHGFPAYTVDRFDDLVAPLSEAITPQDAKRILMRSGAALQVRSRAAEELPRMD